MAKKSIITSPFFAFGLCLLATLFQSPANELSQGEKHAAVLSGSNIQAFGDNSFGQLGHNSSNGYLQGAQKWISISSAGYHNLALDENLNVWSWGRNENGQLGLGNKIDQATPINVSTQEPIIEIEASLRNSYLIGVSGNIYSVGDGSNGLLGFASPEETSFTHIPFSNKVVSISASSTMVVCADENGSVWVWGETGFAQTFGTTPTILAFPEEISRVKAGTFHALALGASGNLYGWGKNATQQLGIGDSIISTPILIEMDVIDFDAGREHSLILTSTELNTLGRNQVSQLGSSDSNSNQEILTSPVNSKITSSGPYENIIINDIAEVHGWGNNDQTQLNLSQEIILTPQNLGITIPLSFKSNSKLTAFSSANITLDLQPLSNQSNNIQTSVIFAPFSSNVINSTSLTPTVNIGTPGTYVFLTSITQAGQTYKRIVKLFVKPSSYGSMIWGENTWNQGNETALDLR